MPDPQPEVSGTTHTYVARVWYRDTATWFNIISFLVVLLQETTFQQVIPARFHPLVLAAITALNLWIRFQSSTRPVALSQGQTRVVDTLPPPPSPPPTPPTGSVSEATRRTLLSVMALALICAPACANKMQPLQTVQVSHDALATAQDLEVNLCLGVPNVAAAATLPAINKCTTELARTLGLTDHVHQALQRQFAIAIPLHRSITAQYASGATRVDVTTLQAAISAILAELAALTPTPPIVQLTAAVKGAQIR